MPGESSEEKLSSVALNHILRELEGIKTQLSRVGALDILMAERSNALERAFGEIASVRAYTLTIEARIRALENEQGLMKLVRRLVITAVIGIIGMVGTQVYQLLQRAPQIIYDQQLRPGALEPHR